MIEYAVLGGFVLDCLFGDPAWLPHPVVYMGKAISRWKSACGPVCPKRLRGNCWAGPLWPSACRWVPFC